MTPRQPKIVTATHKTCSRCRKLLPRSEFGPHTQSTDGLRYYCHDCERETLAATRRKRKAIQTDQGLSQDESVKALVKATRGGPITTEAACDLLDISPRRLAGLLTRMRRAGINVEIDRACVGLQLETTLRDVQTVKVAPTVGERQTIAVISDTHLGSKYCLRAQLREFVEYAYSRGVREILHPGDILDGSYRHARFEMSHVGLEDQIRDLCETLPELPGLTYHAITGNHDFTFTESNGANVGRAISRYFAEHDRRDFVSYGDRSAFLRLRGALIHLWHPRSGGAYARSYHLQKQIEAYAPGEKPQILLAGHWHIYCHLFERGVQAIACPTFQGGGSAFAQSLGGSPAIGGLILSWDLTEDGTLRAFAVEKRSYFEREVAAIVETRDRGIEIPDPPKRDRKPKRG